MIDFKTYNKKCDNKITNYQLRMDNVVIEQLNN